MLFYCVYYLIDDFFVVCFGWVELLVKLLEFLGVLWEFKRLYWDWGFYVVSVLSNLLLIIVCCWGIVWVSVVNDVFLIGVNFWCLFDLIKLIYMFIEEGSCLNILYVFYVGNELNMDVVENGVVLGGFGF